MTLNTVGEFNLIGEIKNEVGTRADVLAVVRSIAPVQIQEIELELAA